MTSLKDHQATMVSMLASGTAIPTSAIRLAHALHDVLAYINDTNAAPEAHTERRTEATTPGLNDAALAYDLAAVKPACKHTWHDTGRELKCKDCGVHPSDTAAVKPKCSSAEQQIAVLNNTIRQLRESNLKLRAINYEMRTHIAEQQSFIDRVKEADAVKLRQSNCEHNFNYRSGAEAGHCLKCGLRNVPEQAADVQAVKPKSQESLESLLKQRENTIRQLKVRAAEVVGERDWLKARLEEALNIINLATAESLGPEQAGCRKEDTQVSPRTCMNCAAVTYRDVTTCDDCGEIL